MKGHKGADSNDKAITTRLVPQLVYDSGAIHDISMLDRKVNQESYCLLYIIWGSHQRYRFQNKDMGYLELKVKRENGSVTFNITKELVTHDNLNQRIEITYSTCNDPMLSPVKFDYSSKITDNALCVRPELCLERSGVVEENNIIEKIKDNEFVREADGPILFDFSLYDLVIRSCEAGNFTYYENLYSMKTNNRLDISDRFSEIEGIPLDMMIHRGRALTERRFYRNMNNVPVMMIQNSVAYILEPNARERVERLKSELNSGGFHYEY